jgi:dTDP-4-amino-4,6-dideoxygalactose transaminase
VATRRIAYRGYPVAPGGLPRSEGLVASALSLPMHSYLEAAARQRAVDELRWAVGAAGAGEPGR